VESLTTSKPSQDGKPVLPLEQDAAHRLVTLDGLKQYGAEEALQVAIILLESAFRAILSPDSLAIVFMEAQHRRPENIDEDTYNKLMLLLIKRADNLRRSNTLSGMF